MLTNNSLLEHYKFTSWNEIFFADSETFKIKTSSNILPRPVLFILVIFGMSLGLAAGGCWGVLNSQFSSASVPVDREERGVINWRNISKWTCDTSSFRAIKLLHSKHADIVGGVPASLIVNCIGRSSLRRLIVYLDLHSYI